jgi:hypothetical protein
LPEDWIWAFLGHFLTDIEAGYNFACLGRPPVGDEAEPVNLVETVGAGI